MITDRNQEITDLYSAPLPDPGRGFAVKSRLLDLLRKILAQFGFVLHRVRSGIPPSLRESLKSLAGPKVRSYQVFCFDSDAFIQNEMLSVFSPKQATFISYPIPTRPPARLFDSQAVRVIPAGPFLVEVDAEFYDLEDLQKWLPWILEGEAILIRASLAFFWAGKGNVGELSRFMNRNNFELIDIVGNVAGDFFNEPLRSIMLVFDKRSRSMERQVSDSQQRRVAEALVFLSPPIAKNTAFIHLAGRGSFGFAGGVYNPGAVAVGESLFLLGRAEHTPWAILKWNQQAFLSGSHPILIRLNETRQIAEVRELSFTNHEEMNGWRVEDFRLFRFHNQLFANHSRFRASGGSTDKSNPVRFDSLQIDVAISRVELESANLTFLGTPKLDRSVARIEKNWVFFEKAEELYMIYSFHPYRLLRANGWSDLAFETVMERKLQLPITDDQIDIRNSINPVDYDQEHFLHIIHKAYADKQYVFWAILIQKASLLPVKISGRPLVRGWSSVPAAIIYACSIVVRADEILVFAGLNDSSTGFWRIQRSELDANWIPLNH